MKITLSKSQMLERLRIAAGLEPLRADCKIEITDGIDVDAILLLNARARYLDMLDNADPRLLAPENLAPLASATSDAPAGGVMIALPTACRRVFHLRLEGWNKTIEILPHDQMTSTINRQKNPFRKATPDRPVAVRCPGSDIKIMAWPGALIPRIADISGIIDPGEDFFTLDEAAINDILPSHQQH